MVAPDLPVPPDAVGLVSTSPRSWELVNHTPVAIEPLGRPPFASSPFGVTFERLGFDGSWHSVYGEFGLGSPPADLAPLTPGASRPVSHPHLRLGSAFSAGTWRAVVAYRDPRHPASPSRAEATFDVVGLSPAQTEAVLAAIANPAHRACEGFTSIAYGFTQTAPLAMLPRLLELPEETVAEREEALVAITGATHDEALLHRALVDENPSVRLAAARAVSRAIPRSSAHDHNLLWLRTIIEILPRGTMDGPLERADVRALFQVIPEWSPEVHRHLLERLANRRAPEVSVALALHFGAYAGRFSHADLLRIRQVLARTVAQESVPEARAHYLRAMRDCTAALDRAPGSAFAVPESNPHVLEPSSFRPPERCQPVYDALRTMMEFATHAERMRFVPHDAQRPATAPSADPEPDAPTSAELPVRLEHPTCGLALQDADAGVPLFAPGGGRLTREMEARGIECVRSDGRVAWRLPPTQVRTNYVEALRAIFCGLSARMYAVEARHNPRRYRLEVARMDFESTRGGEAWTQTQLLLRAPEQALHHNVRITGEVRDLHVEESATTFTAVLDAGGRERVAVVFPADADQRIANGTRVVTYAVVTGSRVEHSSGGDVVVPEVMAFLVVPEADARDGQPTRRGPR